MWNDAIDDPLLPAGTLAFAGVREGINPALIPDDSLAAAENVILDTNGTARTRPGTEWVAVPAAAVVQGMGYYDIPGFERLLVVSNGKLFELPAVGVNTTPTEITGISPALSTSADVVFEQLVDKIYMSDGANYYEIYWDGLAWDVTHQATFHSSATALPGFRVLTVARAGDASFRMLAAGINSVDNDLCYVGNTLNGMQFPSGANIRVGRGNGDPIRAIVSSQDGRLTFCKANSFWYVTPSSGTLSNWGMGAINESIGTLAGRTCCVVGQDIFALTSRGVISIGRLTATDTVNESAIMSTEIQDTLDRINKAAAGTSFAIPWGNYYLLAVPLDAATRPNAILAFNTVTGRWSGHWTGLTPSCAVTTDFADDDQVILGDTTGRLLRLTADVSRDQTDLATVVDIPAMIETKAWHFNAPANPKQLFTLEVLFEDSTGNVDVELIADGRAAVMIEADARTNALPILPVMLPFPLTTNSQLRRGWHLRDQPPAHEVRLRVTAQSGRMTIREVKFQAWADTPKVIT